MTRRWPLQRLARVGRNTAATIRASLTDGTPGLWRATHGSVYSDGDRIIAWCDMPEPLARRYGIDSDPAQTYGNARFIAGARRFGPRTADLLEALAARVEELEEQNAALRAWAEDRAP